MLKSKKRKPDFRRIRPSKTYSLSEIAEALDRRDATVRRWLRDGLPALDEGRPPLVFGSVLQAWLKAKWAAKKHKCGPDELFCCKCRKPSKPIPGSVRIIPNNEKTVSIKAECHTCHTRMTKVGSRAKIAEIEETFRVLTPRMQHLVGCGDPSAKRRFTRQTVEETCDNRKRLSHAETKC
jgi:hypothetical protein